MVISRARRSAALGAAAAGVAAEADKSLPLQRQIHQDIAPEAAAGAVGTAPSHRRWSRRGRSALLVRPAWWHTRIESLRLQPLKEVLSFSLALP
jgi:hypothetical protein